MKLADFAVLSCGVLLNALAQLGLKAATKVSGPLVASDAHVLRRGLDLLVVPSLWYALGAYGLSVIVWLVGLSRVPVSQAYPLLSLGYVLNIGLAWWLLGEVPNGQRVVGTVTEVAGAEVVIETDGREMRIPQAEVQSIAFEASRPAPPVRRRPVGTALRPAPARPARPAPLGCTRPGCGCGRRGSGRTASRSASAPP